VSHYFHSTYRLVVVDRLAEVPHGTSGEVAVSRRSFTWTVSFYAQVANSGAHNSQETVLPSRLPFLSTIRFH